MYVAGDQNEVKQMSLNPFSIILGILCTLPPQSLVFPV